MSPEVRRELQRLLSALCDDRLTDAEHTRLEELLDADAACRQLYLEYLDMHARLLVHPGLRGEQPPAPTRTRRRVPPVLWSFLVAGATLAASLLVQVLWWHPRPAPAGPGTAPASGEAEARPSGYVATLVQAAGCVWEGAADPGRAGSRLLPGELRLRQGVAAIRVDSGAQLTVEGPAVLRLDSASAATVLRGKMVFHGDETAAPFDLRTPSATLVDLGTEYAVAVTADGEEVHVFDGEVRRLPGAGAAAAELLRAGEARAYGPSPESPGRRTPLDPGRFVRRLADLRPAPADPGAGLLAYEGFDYVDPAALPAGEANGGVGWTSPWRPGFARPLNPGDQNLLALNVRASLTRPGAAAPSRGGCFDYTGFTKYFRRMAVPVRLDADGVYYLSLLFRRQGPPADPLNCVAVLLRTSDELEAELGGGTPDPHQRLNVGVGRGNELFTHLHGVGSRTPLPLSYGTTYLLVAKIVASRSHPDQVFLRVYAPEEPVEAEEPGGWSVTGPPFQSDLVFDWLEVHVNSKTRQTMDEIRLGTTWASVTAPWVGGPGPGKGGRLVP